VYSEFSEAVKELVRACAAPELREKITSPSGLESIMRQGLADPAKLSREALAVQEPLRTAEARRALADAGIGPSRKGFAQIARQLPTLRIPVREVYGARDRVLPDVADTMARVKTPPDLH
jgi:hypothetical protein